MMIYYNQGRETERGGERERERDRSIMHQEKDNGCGVADFLFLLLSVGLSEARKKKKKTFFPRLIIDRNCRPYSFWIACYDNRAEMFISNIIMNIVIIII